MAAKRGPPSKASKATVMRHSKVVVQEAEGYPAIDSAEVRARLRADLLELAKVARALRGQI